MSSPSEKPAPQSHMASSTGMMLRPNGVREYSVLGGLSGMTSRYEVVSGLLEVFCGALFGLPAPYERRGAKAGADFRAGGLVRDMLILPAGEYCAYIYDGVQRGCYHFGCAVFHGGPVTSVPEIGRKIKSEFLHRLCGGDGRRCADQL